MALRKNGLEGGHYDLDSKAKKWHFSQSGRNVANAATSFWKMVESSGVALSEGADIKGNVPRLWGDTAASENQVHSRT